MNARPPRRGISREMRLLALTITVSAIVLVVLSRFRFPEQPAFVAVSPAPLERLAARATYDELASIVAGLERTIAPSLVVLRLAAEHDTAPRALGDILRALPDDRAPRHAPALRLDGNTAVAAGIDATSRIVGIVGPDNSTPPAELLAADPLRRLALVRVPDASIQSLRQVTLADLQTPTYVVVVEGTRAGLTFRPVFVGSSDRFQDPRWTRPLLAVSSAALTAPGALVFSLEGQFLGCAVVDAGTLAIAGAADVLAAADALKAGSPGRVVDPGITVQPLTPALAAGLRVKHGAVIAHVDPAGPAAAALQTGDVITALDDLPIESADDFLVRLALRRGAGPIRLSVLRQGAPLAVEITAPPPAAEGERPGGDLTLAAARGRGSLVQAVAPESGADVDGLRPGDTIVRAGEVEAPSPDEIRGIREKVGPGAVIVLTVERGGRRHVVAVPGAAAPATISSRGRGAQEAPRGGR